MNTKIFTLIVSLLACTFCFRSSPAQADQAKEKTQSEHFSYTNAKGKTYYLYKKEVTLKNSDKVRTIYFFAKSPDNKKGIPLKEVPANKIVAETKNGLPVLKNKATTK